MATYQTLILLNLSKWDNPKKPGTGYSLDVVQSVTDGRNMGVGVEKVYYKDNGAKRMGRPLQRMDFKRCAEKWKDIIALMEKPPAVPPPPAAEPLTGGTLGGGGGLGGGSLGGGSLGGGTIDRAEDF